MTRKEKKSRKEICKHCKYKKMKCKNSPCERCEVVTMNYFKMNRERG